MLNIYTDNSCITQHSFHNMGISAAIVFHSANVCESVSMEDQIQSSCRDTWMVLSSNL